MCELYPAFRSCCGIPLRIGLVFIAILAIVTGALINGAIRKAGINVSSIQDVKQVLSPPEENTNNTGNNNLTALAVPLIENAADDVVDVETTTRRRRRTTTTTTTKPLISTVEIVGEDVVRDADDTERFNEETDDDEVTTTTTSTTTQETTTTAKPDNYSHTMGKMNRNGLNLLSIAFIVLGIVLLIANFINSPEMALFWVAMCIVVWITSLVLFATVIGECSSNQQACLLRQMDWLSAFIVMLVWFVSIFAWAFFAAVGNGYARTMQPV